MRPREIMGAYVGENSAASRTDARVKIALLFAATVTMFRSTGPVALAISYAALAACLAAAHVRPASVARAARPVAVILLFTLCANLISCDGTGDIALVGPLGLDTAGGLRGLSAILRIVCLLGGSLVVSASTTPTQIGDACVRIMRPLGRLGVPVGAVGMVLLLALRFIPLVAEEFERVRQAQRARGVKFDEGGIVARVRVWGSVLTPLIVGLFRRADRLAESIAARCYADTGAVAVPARPLTARDRVVLVAGFAICIATAVLPSALA